MTMSRAGGMLVAVMLACLVTTPAAQTSGQCGYLWIGGGYSSEQVFGWTMVEAYSSSVCEEFEDMQVFAAVQVVTPWGASAQDFDEGYAGAAWADAAAPLQPGESGWAQVLGTGGICFYFCFYGEPYQDAMSLFLPPPQESPTISFSPSSSVTASYNSGDVIITANVSPPGQGWEGQLYWVGNDCQPVAGNPLQCRFSTNAVATLQATAVIAPYTEAVATVQVIPVITLSPTDVTVPLNPQGAVVITASVQPPEYISQIVWSGSGYNYPPENIAVRYVPTNAVGDWYVFANLSQGPQQQAVVRVTQSEDQPELKLFLDLDMPGTSSAFENDGMDNYSAFLPGSDATGASLPTSIVGGTGQEVRLIAAFVNESGQIVSPPTGVDEVIFSFANVSQYQGYAMNAGPTTIGVNDFSLASPSALFSQSPSGKLAAVTLRVHDYGGWVTVQATVNQPIVASVVLRLPQPVDPNNVESLPLNGWRGYGGGLVSSNTVPGLDDEPDAANGGVGGGVGDGLSWYNEYRGVIYWGQHYRLYPTIKDLFVYSELPEGTGFASSLPIWVWQLNWDEFNWSSRQLNFNSAVNNYQQRVLRIVDGGASPTDLFGETPEGSGGGPNHVISDGNIKIFTTTIRWYSPPINDPGIPNDVDPIQFSKTLAHEIGHGLNIAHVQVNLNQGQPICSPAVSPDTVMVWGAAPQTTDDLHPCWVNIPSSYRQVDIDQLLLR